MADDEAVTHRLRQVDAPLDLLLEALRLDVELGLTVSVAALDRVAEEGSRSVGKVTASSCFCRPITSYSPRVSSGPTP
ncbi:hypothetical protein [Ornithinimicrobium kibberense]|uniref:Uncharacterized protein n=1 Tax=Ornithinimicrobium kibberense TaxID=282060 RepID=A0ABV5V3B7_9MICO|nr:hypothetical protein [Ornithinimicrobium kibberense]